MDKLYKLIEQAKQYPDKTITMPLLNYLEMESLQMQLIDRLSKVESAYLQMHKKTLDALIYDYEFNQTYNNEEIE